MAEETKSKVGPVSILVNNAGIVSGTALLDTSDEKIIRTFDVNIMAHFWTIKAFLPDMISNRQVRVINIATLLSPDEGPFLSISAYNVNARVTWSMSPAWRVTAAPTSWWTTAPPSSPLWGWTRRSGWSFMFRVTQSISRPQSSVPTTSPPACLLACRSCLSVSRLI